MLSTEVVTLGFFELLATVPAWIRLSGFPVYSTWGTYLEQSRHACVCILTLLRIHPCPFVPCTYSFKSHLKRLLGINATSQICTSSRMLGLEPTHSQVQTFHWAPKCLHVIYPNLVSIQCEILLMSKTKTVLVVAGKWSHNNVCCTYHAYAWWPTAGPTLYDSPFDNYLKRPHNVLTMCVYFWLCLLWLQRLRVSMVVMRILISAHPTNAKRGHTVTPFYCLASDTVFTRTSWNRATHVYDTVYS